MLVTSFTRPNITNQAPHMSSYVDLSHSAFACVERRGLFIRADRHPTLRSAAWLCIAAHAAVTRAVDKLDSVTLHVISDSWDRNSHVGLLGPANALHNRRPSSGRRAQFILPSPRSCQPSSIPYTLALLCGRRQECRAWFV